AVRTLDTGDTAGFRKLLDPTVALSRHLFALLAATGGEPALPYAVGLLPGLLLLPAGGALSFAGAAVLATERVPAARAGLAGGVLNTAMELGPTVVFAALLTLGGSAAPLAAAAALFAALAFLIVRLAK
ncbi:MFS transporter, partial [Streptomyces hydrogenans]